MLLGPTTARFQKWQRTIKQWFPTLNDFGCGHFLDDVARLCRYLLKWAISTIPLRWAVGSACVGSLWSLDAVTHHRVTHPWLLWCLPFFGALEACIYRWLGREAEDGSNLVIDSSHEPAMGIQTRMAPLVYVGTILTHLGGGSAGREGTAVQIRGGIASALARWYHMGQSPDKRSF